MPVEALRRKLPRETHSRIETRELGRQLGEGLVVGDVVVLSGPLGAGKTELAGGIAEALGVERSVVASPTFTVLHEYEGDRALLFHLDFYRLDTAEDALALGLEDYFNDGISVVEWGEKFPDVLPSGAIRIRIEALGGDRREIALEETA